MSFLDNMKAVTSADDLKVVELPSGIYEMQIISIDPEKVLKADRKRFDKVFPEGNEYMMLMLKPTEAVEVDEEDLDQCSDWKEKVLVESYFDDDEIKSGFIPLIDAAGLDVEEYISSVGFAIEQVIKDLLKRSVLVTVERTFDEKNSRSYVNVRKVGPVE